MPSAEHARVLISGRVQGVGFRQATFDHARQLGLHGWVRNLPDGRVEALFQGDRDTIQQMIVWCGRGPALARVENVQTEWISGSNSYSDFEIAF